ncbi:MAG: phosphatase PAP2 family protein [Saprospiraceae bacterium]|nr:phosphatase PAP2 family protein [Saprospiraceae bacterium]
MDFLLELDYNLFYWINQQWSNSLFDFILPTARNKYVWIPFYVFILSFIFFNYKMKGFKIILILFLVVGISDSVSSHIIKKNVQRIRPCNNDQMEVVERIHCGSGYSFTSSHAANHFAIATFLSLVLVRRRSVKWLLFTWAGVISLAQVYVGVHFPLDIICGMILGILIARVGNHLIAIWNAHPKIQVSA